MRSQTREDNYSQQGTLVGLGTTSLLKDESSPKEEKEADIQTCDRVSEFHLPSSHQVQGNRDQLQSLCGLTEAGASCREVPRT